MKNLFTINSIIRNLFSVLICSGLFTDLWAQTITQTFSYTGNLQTFTVPVGVTNLTVNASGAQGGNGGGLGANIIGTVSVSPGNVIRILVGGQGGMDQNNDGGGGGGSFVWNNSGNTLLIAAGGGGGRSGNSNGSLGGPGSGTNSPSVSINGSGNGASGSGGNGGAGGANLTGYPGGGGGAGWSSNGGTGASGNSSGATGGVNPLAGGSGGVGVNTCSNQSVFGGYGGGGGAASCSGASGGGGGYNGGGGGNGWNGGTWGSGGGGGSYNNGSNQTNTSGVQSGNGTVTISYIPLAAALNFNNSYVNLGTSITNSLTGTNKITVEAWVYPTSNTGLGNIVGNYNTSTWDGQYRFMIRRDNSNYSFYIGTGSAAGTASSAANTVVLNTWQHLVGTWDGTTVRLFINGTQVATANCSGTFAAFSHEVWIGGNSMAPPNANTEYFTGSIDEVRIWGRAVCGNEVQNNMNCELNPSGQSGLLALYHFNQGVPGGNNPTVTSLTDGSGNNVNGTLTGFALTGSSSNWVSPGGVTGGNCSAYTPPVASISANGPTTFCEGSSVILTATSGSSYLWNNGATTQSITVNASGTYSVTVISAVGCSLTASQSVTVNPSPNVAVSPSTSAVCAGSSVTLNTSTQGLIGYWKMNEGTGSTTADASGNNLTATFVGSENWTAASAPAVSSNPAAINFTGGYLNVPDNAVFSSLANSNISVEAWIYQTDLSNNTIIDRANYNFLFECEPNGQPGLGFYNLNGGWSYSTTPLPANTWTHVAFTWNVSTGTLRFYVNGTLTDTYSRGALYNNAGPLNIGRQEPNNCQCNTFNGSLDEVRLFNVTRSQADIQSTMNANLALSNATSFVWSPSTGLNTTSGPSVIATPTVPTTYTVTGSSAAGCSKTATASVSINALPTVTASGNSPVAAGSALNLTSSGATTYSWTGPNGFTSTSQNPSISNAQTNASGTYTVTGNNNGCNASANVAVLVQVDSDKDGVPDVSDADDDNDGIPDASECNKSNFYWSNAPSVSGSSATGTINGIGYTYTSSRPVSTTTSMYGNNVFPASYGVPNSNPTIQNIYVTNNTLTFASPMTNPVLVFASIGQGGLRVPISFGAPVEVLWSQNVTVNSSTQITGEEGYAIVRMNGTFSNISFNYQAEENWCNFAFGADFQSCGDTDNDGIADYLDLDSDGDGCADAVEGSMNFLLSQTINNHLMGAVSSDGIPVLAGSGQTIGLSKTASANCSCQPNIDRILPTVIAKNITANLDISGIVTITAAQVNNGSSDGCGIGSMSLSKSTFDCTNVGPNSVTLTVTDVNGNSATGTATVQVVDNTAPVVHTQPVTINLSASGVATITPEQVDNGSSDACGIHSVSLSKTTFTCANIGNNNVILTVRDMNGNTSTGVAVVSVKDVTSPEIVCASDLSVHNDLNKCGAVVNFNKPTATDACSGGSANPIVNGSFEDNYNGWTIVSSSCGIWAIGNTGQTLNTSQNIFNYGTNSNSSVTFPQGLPVTFSPTDGTKMAAFFQNCGAIHKLYQDVTLPYGNVGLTFDMKYRNFAGAFSTSQYVAIEIVNPSNGAVLTTLFKTDSDDPQSINMTPFSFNLSAFAGQTVRIQMVDAVIQSSPLNVFIDNVKISGGINIVQTAGLPSGSLFPIGTTTNTFVATDSSGNSSTCSFDVTVEDNQAPKITCPSNISLIASSAAGAVVNFTTPAATDNCSATVAQTDGPMSGSVFPIGMTTVTFRATDLAGNFTDCSFTVHITGLPPAIVSPGTITSNTENGNCSAHVTYAATETTGIPASTTIYSIAPGSIFPVGTTQVTATATNAVGSSSCTFDVVVEDHEVPAAMAQNISVNLDASGNAAITAEQLNNGSTDACGVASLSINKTTFNCSNVGENEVELTVTDVHGNHSAVTATVTVNDVTAPVAVAQNISVDLDASGNATITAEQLNNGSTDACGVASLSINKATFNCSNVGPNTVELTVTDVHGNQSATTATATVNDVTAPVAVAQNISVDLNASGNVSITAAQVNNGSSDACGIASMTLDKTAFNCSNVGANTVKFTVKDVNGNASSVYATVTVNDVTPAVVVTQNISINLDATGHATITPANVNNGSSDACGIAMMSLSKTNFDCSNVGANMVTLTVKDVNRNSSSASATVTVNDVTKPVVNTQNLTVTIAGGSVSITAAQVNNGSSDACGIASMSVSPSTFNCSKIGNNTVTLTVTDVNGNVNTGTATVTVIGVVPTCSINAVASGTIIGNATTYAATNQMFLGYGKQSMTLTVTANGAGPFTYSWSGLNLSTATGATTVFTPTAGGNYTFICTATNSYGCQTTCSITICVIDVRDPNSNANNPKVIICHLPPGNPANQQTLSVGVSAVPAHVGQHGGDKLGSCNAVCGFSKTDAIGELITEETPDGEVNLIVYPNPSNNEFNFRIESNSTEEATVTIYDITGKMVMEIKGKQPHDVITVSGELSVGVYVAKVIQGSFNKSVKITKVN